MLITSKSNNVYKTVKKLNSKSQREKNKMYILEGTRLVNDAISNGAKIEYIIVSSEYKGDVPEGIVYEFDKNMIKK